MLQPLTNIFRTTLSLSGYWDFDAVPDDYVPRVPLERPRVVGVPSSHDEIYADAALRDHVGRFCYERRVDFPGAWREGEVRIRFGAAANAATVHLDGVFVGGHEGGFLPFEVVVPPEVVAKGSCRLSVVLDNRLRHDTLPPGEVETRDGKSILRYNHDFANATGLHRDVLLCHLPVRPLRDIVVRTSGHGATATVAWTIDTDADAVTATVLSPDGTPLATATGRAASVVLDHPRLWDLGEGVLHTLAVRTETDAYDLRFGIRDVAVREGAFLLNGRPVRFRGFGMHEDHVTVGKAAIPALIVRDFELLRWIGANSFRTSHYPYDEGMLDLADRAGILVIDEVPAVGMNFWGPRPVFVPGMVDDRTLATHRRTLSELVARDKNHPSVVMVSVANEAATYEAAALPYFEAVFAYARTLTSLPLMIVENVGATEAKVAQLADVVGLNKYIGWYSDLGDLEAIGPTLTRELEAFHARFGTPILLTECGADTIAGLHRLPPAPFSEEYQAELLAAYHAVIAKLPFVLGMHVWNFADFMTKPGLIRVDGNRKGVFTRDRQPKLAAHRLRALWAEGKED